MTKLFFESSKITGLCPFKLLNYNISYKDVSYNDMKKSLENIIQMAYNESLCRGSLCEHWKKFKDDPRFGSCDKYE